MDSPTSLMDIAMSHRFLLAAAFAGVLTGCAPDTVSNYKATGFNAFLTTIQVQCSPLLLGGQEMSWALQSGAGDNNYNYFLDQTSKLYYQQIGPGGYSESLTAFFGAGYDRAINCVIAKLPAP
jgi:hypothetical protein